MQENSKKSKSDTPVITSPDGVQIKITEGRKLQLIREYARDPLVTDAQFRALVVMTDRTNEGYGSDETKWGYSYANYETLAQDTAKTPSAVKRIVQELESGEREVGTGKKKEVKLCRVALSVERDSRPGRSKVNRYWQSDWNNIAAVEGKEKGPAARPFQNRKGPVSEDKGSGLSDERVRFSGQKGPAARPDSSFTDSPQRPTSQYSKNACGADPAVDDVSDRPHPKQPGNDNDHEWPSAREAMMQFFDAYPKGGNPSETSKALEVIRKEGRTTFADILRGARNYARQKKFDETPLQFYLSPVNFLKQEEWLGHQKKPEPVWRKAHAI